MSEGIDSPKHEGETGRPRIDAACEDAFCEYLRVRTTGAGDFDAFCAKHPEFEPGLRALHAEWSRVHLLMERLGGSVSISERLKSRFGEVDPGISLHSDESDPSGGAAIRLLEKLAAKRPASTRYDIRGELGRGGMGIVYKVWDEDLRRQLAMKVVLGKRDSSGTSTQVKVEPRRMSRFLEEAQITGQLDHPGILPVHELGIDPDGRVYFTMRLVEGSELREVFGLARKNKDGWSRTRVLGILLRVCEAMAFAHSKGVIHRDIKPANIMVGRFGAVYVMDWGLAKVLGREDSHDLRLREEETEEDAGDSGLAFQEGVATDRSDSSSEHHEALVTMDGDIVGTPSYMSPEQASGHLDELGPRADVYSVGAMLYELLTGQMPYEPLGERVPAHTILNAVRTTPPWPVLDIAPETPLELVAICEKAMSRKVEDRYADMSEFATDVRAYLEGHVVRAYETGVSAEVKKWMVRNKAAALVGIALLVVILGSISTFIWQQQNTVTVLETEKTATSKARDEALSNLTLARESEKQMRAEKLRADEAVLEARANLERAETNKAEAELQATHARENAQQAQLQELAAERKSYLAGLVAADYSLRLGEVKEAKRSLAACEPSMRGWEWQYLEAQADTAVEVFEQALVEPFFSDFLSGNRFVAASRDLGVVVRDLNPDHPSEVLFRSPRSNLVTTAESVPESWVATMHPGGRLLAISTLNSAVSVWDLESQNGSADQKPVRTFLGHQEDKSVRAIAISPDGSFLASAAGDMTVRVFDFETGASLAVLAGLESAPRALEFSPGDSLQLAIAGPGASLSVWDWSVKTEPLTMWGHYGTVNDVAWSPDGQQLASVSEDGTLRLWNPSDGDLQLTISEHSEEVTCLEYGLIDGKPRIVTGSKDTTVRLWDPRDGRVLRVLAGHEKTVNTVQMESDGERILSSSEDRTIRLWAPGDSQGIDSLSLRGDEDRTRIVDCEFDAEGRRFLAVVERSYADPEVQGQLNAHGEVQIRSRDSRKLLATYKTDSNVQAAAFVEQGRTLAVLLAPSAQRIGIATPAMVGTLEFDAIRLVLVNAETGEYLRDLSLGQSRQLLALATNYDGSRVAVAGYDSVVLVFDVATGEITHRLGGHKRRIYALAFSPDGRSLASGGKDKTVRVWSLESGETVRILKGHRWQINALKFDEKGGRLASGSSDRTARLWDLRSGDMIHEFMGHDGAVLDLSFTASGRRLVTGCGDNYIRVFDVASGEALLRIGGHTASVNSLSVSPDGTSVLSSSADGSVRMWESQSARERAALRNR